MIVEDILKTLLEKIKLISQAQSVVGEPINVGDVTVIPVSKMSIGFGVGGGGRDEKEKKELEKAGVSVGGTGGGVTIEPVACIVIDKNNKATMLSLTEIKPSTLAKVIDLVPDVVAKLAGEKLGSGKGKEKEKGESASEKS